MTQEYTPTDQQVIDDYMPDEENIGFDALTMTHADWKRLKIAAFDRWLAAHDAQIRAEAWDEGRKAEIRYQDCLSEDDGSIAAIFVPQSPINPYRKEQKQ